MKDWWCLAKHIKNNKYFEWQVGHYTKSEEKSNIFNFSIDWNRRCDHAGLYLTFEVWNFYSFFNIYDNRHWCYHCNKYQTQTCIDECHEEIF